LLEALAFPEEEGVSVKKVALDVALIVVAFEGQGVVA
jgi:hypothetical protein